MTASEQAEYGNSLNIWQALKLLQTWHPVISYGQRFVQTVDPYQKGLIVAEAVEWLAAKTDATTDDQLVRHLSEVLKTKEGESLVRFCLGLAGVQ
jgi:alpha-L-fucosidase